MLGFPESPERTGPLFSLVGLEASLAINPLSLTQMRCPQPLIDFTNSTNFMHLVSSYCIHDAKQRNPRLKSSRQFSWGAKYF